MKTVDQIVNARWVIPIIPQETILNHHAIVIDQGKIINMLPQQEVYEHYTAKEVSNFNHHAITPGFINAHTHLAMSLFKGFADDLDLDVWLNQHIWPAESANVSADMVYQGTRLALAELIRSGVTCVNDTYFFPRQVIQAIDEAQMRGVVANGIFNFPTSWVSSPDEHITIAIETIKQLKDYKRINAALGPHAPYTTDDAIMEKMTSLSKQYKTPVHIHLHETEKEVFDYKQKTELSPIEYFAKKGWLHEYFIAVHVTQLTENEAQILATNKVSVVHCPESNMKLSSGAFPWKMLKEKGVNIALGTDGSASNNDLDMFGEIKSASFLAKLQYGPEHLNAYQALEMLTINGAKALHIEDQVGSLEIGKQADLIAIDLYQPETLPVYNPVSQIIYAASRCQVTDVWCNGQKLLNKRELQTINLVELYDAQQLWQSKIINSVKKQQTSITS